jgi:hypothetical protein
MFDRSTRGGFEIIGHIENVLAACDDHEHRIEMTVKMFPINSYTFAKMPTCCRILCFPGAGLFVRAIEAELIPVLFR